MPPKKAWHAKRLCQRQRQCRDGVAVPCPRWRLEFLLQGGKRGEACLSEASLPPLPPCDINSRSVSPSRARLSLLTFFGKTKKVSQPRQGMKQRWTTSATRQGMKQRWTTSATRQGMKQRWTTSTTPAGDETRDAPPNQIPKHKHVRAQPVAEIQRKKPGARPGTGPPR